MIKWSNKNEQKQMMWNRYKDGGLKRMGEMIRGLGNWDVSRKILGKQKRGEVIKMSVMGPRS